MAKAMGNCEIFVASDIFMVPRGIGDLYRRIRNICKKSGREVFMPLDYSGNVEAVAAKRTRPELGRRSPVVGVMTREQLGVYQSLMQLSLNQVNVAKLGVFYIGHNSTEVGQFLGGAKMNNLPVILMYEKAKEVHLKSSEPKVWLALKSKKDIARVREDWDPSMPHPISSRGSFLNLDKEYEGIVGEIVFDNADEGMARLEEAVGRFFSE